MAESRVLEIVEAGSERSLIKDGPREVLTKGMRAVALIGIKREYEKVKISYGHSIKALVAKHYNIQECDLQKCYSEMDKYEASALEEIALRRAIWGQKWCYGVNILIAIFIIYLSLLFTPVALASFCLQGMVNTFIADVCGSRGRYNFSNFFSLRKK